jgi:hypothetical protein
MNVFVAYRQVTPVAVTPLKPWELPHARVGAAATGPESTPSTTAPAASDAVDTHLVKNN